MRIRAVTLHVRWDDDFSIVDKFLQVTKDINALTIRISVSPPPPGQVEKVIKTLRDRGVKYISALHLYYNAEDIYRLVSQYEVFGTLNDVLEYVKFLKNIYSKGEIHLSRYISLIIGGHVYNSPYFPASLSTERGLSVSLLYPNDIENVDDISFILKKGEEMGRYIAELIGVKFLGLDGSLSPWGEESVAKAVERIFGMRLGNVGSHYAIYRLNKAIKEAEVKKVGFNEVMLPLAEDEELKRLVREGVLDLSKLISYISVCVPGLDMAPIKISQWDRLRRLLYDLLAIAEVKKRPIGVRIFPVDTDEYYIEGFGNTPALVLG